MAPLSAVAGKTVNATLKQAITISPKLKVYEYHYPNGLTVVLVPNKKAPRTTVYHLVKVGSLHERPGITGIAHLFEHMMFRPLRPGAPGFDDLVKGLGASKNATTRFASTHYYTLAPAKHLQRVLEIEADRFQHLQVTKELLDVEREAVRSEYSTGLDANPIWDLWFTIYRAAFRKHPYEWMITGFREDLEKITAKDCNEFFAKYYKPNNVGLFIAGDFSRKKVLKWISQYYGGWVSGEKTELPLAYQHNDKYVFQQGKLKSSVRRFLIGYRIPEWQGERRYIVEVANYILFAANYSLADRRLLFDQKLVSMVSSFNFDYARGMAKVLVNLLPATTLQQAMGAIDALRQDFRNLPEREFQAYLRQWQISLAESIQRNFVLVEGLSHSWNKFGDIKYAIEESRQPLKVEKGSVQTFIDRYFVKSNMVVVSNKS